ncbi:hypothetical protein XBO1_1240084 [Xenorhabdus bovienii str. oregonense]|uniref:Uncharacterized protein n=1 Tax=Xenorhabdus bovienii str. oregonense TaxID=1398202 RepID=A0A077P0Y9_XENBV|nr:hypothetical protein XBO1_1240084 [Xenorhabdus bovienii str. oregonense]
MVLKTPEMVIQTPICGLEREITVTNTLNGSIAYLEEERLNG